MALSWKNIAVARANCGADVFGLAGFLRDDDLISHGSSPGRHRFNAGNRTYRERRRDLQAARLTPGPPSPSYATVRTAPLAAIGACQTS